MRLYSPLSSIDVVGRVQKMKFADFSRVLNSSSAQSIEIRFKGAGTLAVHFHVTEVGKVTRDFVDCGGGRRTETTCILQTLVAHDTDHRLSAPKLADILSRTNALEFGDDLQVDVETQGKSIETWRIATIEAAQDRLVLHLEPKRTTCLAPDKCGISDELPMLESPCCGENGCC